MAAATAVVDHYQVLGLPIGEEGVKLSEKEISRAFKAKALELHPDKRPGVDPAKANSDFQKLQQSYKILIDPTSRQLFDATLLNGLRSPPQLQRKRHYAPPSDNFKRRKVDEEWGWKLFEEEVARRRKRYVEEEARQRMMMGEANRRKIMVNNITKARAERKEGERRAREADAVAFRKEEEKRIAGLRMQMARIRAKKAISQGPKNSGFLNFIRECA